MTPTGFHLIVSRLYSSFLFQEFVQSFMQVCDRVLLHFLFHCGLNTRQLIAEQSGNVPANRAFGIRMVVHPEQGVILNSIHRLIHIPECDLVQRFCKFTPAGSPWHGDESGIPELSQQSADQNGIGADAACQKFSVCLFFTSAATHP